MRAMFLGRQQGSCPVKPAGIAFTQRSRAHRTGFGAERLSDLFQKGHNVSTRKSIRVKDWEPIWGMKVPDYEDPFSSSVGHGLIIPIDDIYGDDRRRALCEAIISIMYGIVNGPMLVEGVAL
jgi:hypothetical protein